MPHCEYVSSSTGIRCGNSGNDLKLNAKNYCEIHDFVDYIYDNIVSARQLKLGAPLKGEGKICDIRGNVIEKIGWVGIHDDEELLRCSSDWLQYNHLEGNDNIFYENFPGTTIHGEGPFTELEVLRNQEMLINEEIKMLEALKKINNEELASKNAFYRQAMLQELCDGAFVVKTPEEIRLKKEIEELFKYSNSFDKECQSMPWRSNYYRIRKERLAKVAQERNDRIKRDISDSPLEKIDEENEEEVWYTRTCSLESLENGKCEEQVMWPSAYCRNHITFDKMQTLFETCETCQNSYTPPLECIGCLQIARLNKIKQVNNQNPRMVNLRPSFEIRRNIPTMRMKGFDSSIVVPIRKVSINKVPRISFKSKFEMKLVNGDKVIDLNKERVEGLKEDVKENNQKNNEETEVIELIDNYFCETRIPIKQLPVKSLTQVPATVTLPDRRQNSYAGPKPSFTLTKPVGVLNPVNSHTYVRTKQKPQRRSYEAIKHHPILGSQFKQNPCAKIRPFNKDFFPASDNTLTIGRAPYVTTGSTGQRIKMIVMKPVVNSVPRPVAGGRGQFYFKNVRPNPQS
uniref:Zf-C3Hc3H domain-containing protein n=1 Tax=Parastrongyloides trichosuri TaxID=131310 RepID=A0A0N4Z0W5_PARTI